MLKDGDEIIVGRYRLSFLNVEHRSQAIGEIPAAGAEMPGQASLSDSG